MAWPQKKPKPTVSRLRLALSTITYLERLVRQGTHGTSVPGVARTLIEEGIRLAIKDGLLAIRDNGKTP